MPRPAAGWAYSVPLLVGLLLPAGCSPGGGAGPSPSPGRPAAKPAPAARASAMSLTSSSFSEGGTIPVPCTCDGANRSPALRWSGAPSGTQGLALIVYDPDAPGGDFAHWLLYDIPGGTAELPE